MDTLIDELDRAVSAFGPRPALIIRPGIRTRTWTYDDLGRTVPRVAAALAASGLEPGDRVVLWAVNRPEWGLGFLGAVHAGIVLVPLDFRSQTEFAARVAAQTRAKAVLASRQTEAQAAELGLPVILIESLPERAAAADPLPPAKIGPDSLVEIVFTSGTTGEPKGAMITHRNLVSNAVALRSVFPFKDDERLLSILPLSHLYEQTCGFITPLGVGAGIVYPVSRQPAVLMRTLREFRVTMLLLVPAALKLIDAAINRKVQAAGKEASFARLHRLAARLPRPLRRVLFRPVLAQFGGRFRTLAVGAAALEPSLAERWTRMGFDVLQGYGATELSPAVAFTRPDANRIGTVGQALPGIEIRIADDGEVLVRGPNVFAGYWENAEATAAAVDGEGYYHTGDIGELDGEGFLTLRGRKKDMLAMPDGTKVYPDDVEAILTRDQRLRDGAVVGWSSPSGELKVHAVLLLDDPSLADAIIRDANARLGPHQQIRAHTIWPDDDLPRTASLKVKRKDVLTRLAELEANAGSARADELVADAPAVPVSPLVAIVAGVADVPATVIEPTARLSSDLNLDSLSRVELLGVIEEELGVFIDDGDLDPEASVAELQQLVGAARDAKHAEGIFGWPLNPVVRAIGIGIQVALMRPWFSTLYRVRVSGADHLDGLEGPVLFAPNHHLHNDVGILLTHMPLRWRWRMSVAAAADDIFGRRVRGVGAAIIGNAFPLAREGAIRRSLELLGARLDRGFSVLIFPEGKLTVGGPLQPFKTGTGLVAVDASIAVVPMHLRVNRISRLDSGDPADSWRGDVELVYGEPLRFAWDADHVAATERIEAAVADLGVPTPDSARPMAVSPGTR